MKQKVELPVIEVSGSSYEIGFLHGTKAKQQIDVTVSVYKSMFLEVAGLSWTLAKRIAKTYENSICKFNPKYLDEIRGIADGSGYEYEEILALNVRSELVFLETHLTTDGCTSIAVTSERTDKKTTYLGQNWDWKIKIIDGIILLKIKQKEKPDITVMTEAGIIGKIGCNSAGIGVCFNALSVNDASMGVPIHMILRDILEQDSLVAAMQTITRNKIACPANILVASQYEAIDFEVEIDDFDAIYPTDGIITHTNHYISPRLPKSGHKDMAKCKFPDTFIRRGNAEKFMRNLDEPISVENLKSVLSSHSDSSCSICHHEENNGPDSDGIGTVFSIIMDLAKNECYISFGRPCENEYKKYTIK